MFKPISIKLDPVTSQDSIFDDMSQKTGLGRFPTTTRSLASLRVNIEEHCIEYSIVTKVPLRLTHSPTTTT